SQDLLANKYLDSHFLNFYRKHLISYFSEEGSIDECFSLLMEATQKLDYTTLNKYDRVLKKEIKTNYQNKINLYKKVNKHTKQKLYKKKKTRKFIKKKKVYIRRSLSVTT